MSLINFYLQQLNEESVTTRRMLERVPTDKLDWTPHVKSMDIRRLSTHIAELPAWITMAITTDELDFESNPYEAKFIDSNEELMALFEESLTNGRTQLVAENEEKLNEKWILRSGDTILSESTKSGIIRMAPSQIIHHRAQLGVYLRLLDIPIPGSYGPSADEATFKQDEEAVAV
ncbi:MAG: DinB family protein [Mucilaginibacter sp.]|nr:DinB family protein [Mucilaginibacter sp.]